MSVWTVVSARMASSRCPGKALAPLAGRPLVEVLLERMASSRATSGTLLATSEKPENDPLASLARAMGIPCYRGSEEDVLERHIEAAALVGATDVVRVTGDNPLTDLETLEALVSLHLAQEADYTYVPGDALLMGILPEVVSCRALRVSWQRGNERHRSELVTLYIKEHPDEFRISLARLGEGLYRPDLRLTGDEPEDVALMQGIFSRLARPGHIVTTREAIALLDSEPALAETNAHLRHKPANLRSVSLDSGIAGGRG